MSKKGGAGLVQAAQGKPVGQSGLMAAVKQLSREHPESGRGPHHGGSAHETHMPLAGLKPGPYVCQLNVIDDAGGSFAFPRFAVLVREPSATAPGTQPAEGASSSGSGSGFAGANP